MKTDMIKIEWDLLGAKLANLGSDEQGKFFKGFAFELGRYESAYKRQMQMCYVADSLNQKEKETLEEALPCLWEKGKE